MTAGYQVVQIRHADHNVFVLAMDIINQHRAEHCARHDAGAGLCPYERALDTELAYGREHPEALHSWVREQAHWAELAPLARLLRESWRG